LLWRALEVAVQIGDGRNVRSFALRFCASGFAPFGALASHLQLAAVFHASRERIAPLAERDSPERDSASRITFERCVESLNGVFELEGVQQRHGSIEFLLRLSIA
jgi:hypothetical protein